MRVLIIIDCEREISLILPNFTKIWLTSEQAVIIINYTCRLKEKWEPFHHQKHPGYVYLHWWLKLASLIIMQY